MLGSKGIIKERNKGNIIIDPFNPLQVNPNSYDIRLGEWFIMTKETHAPVSLEDPGSNIWQEPIHVSMDGTFILEPGQCILAHSHEYIGSYKHATLLKARSTFGRLFIDICPSAGFGDVGYFNRWTLEIKNNSPNFYILKPGMRIAQIAFTEVKEIGNLYKGAYYSIRKEYVFPNYSAMWKPEDMLPRLGSTRVF